MHDTTRLTPEQLIAIDRRADHFEAALKKGARPRIEDYLADCPAECRGFLLRQLLLLELDRGRRQGEAAGANEYQARFPGDLDLIQDIFAENKGETTRTFSGAVPAFVPSLQPGAVLGGYELLEEIGRGGMGLVYKARQLSLDRNVALKLLATAGADRAMRQRFLLEARLAARLRHPNIAAIYEVNDQGPWPFYSMDLVEGENLAQVVRRQGPLEPKRAARYARQIALAIAFAHGQHILHRDLKPANVLLDASDQPRVTDFGLAKQTDVSSELTSTGAILGTPGYMPPEQAGAGEVTLASDVYSLGALLYHLLTGTAPFQGATAAAVLRQVLDDPAPSPRLKAPHVPADLEAVCLKCLEKEPTRRYPGAAALAEDLGRFLDGRLVQARPPRQPGRLGRWVRRHRLASGLAMAAVLLAGLWVGWLWLRGGEDRSQGEKEAAATALQDKERSKTPADKRAEGLVPAATSTAVFHPGLYFAQGESPGRIYGVDLEAPRNRVRPVYLRRPKADEANPFPELWIGGLAFDREGNLFLSSGHDGFIYKVSAGDKGAPPVEQLFLTLNHPDKQLHVVGNLCIDEKSETLYCALFKKPQKEGEMPDGEIWSVPLRGKAVPTLVRKVVRKELGDIWWGNFAVQGANFYVPTGGPRGRVFRLEDGKPPAEVYVADTRIGTIFMTGPWLYYTANDDRVFLSHSFKAPRLVAELGEAYWVRTFAISSAKN